MQLLLLSIFGSFPTKNIKLLNLQQQLITASASIGILLTFIFRGLRKKIAGHLY